MAVEHAFGIAGGAASIAKAAAGVLVEFLPGEILTAIGNEVLIGNETGNFAIRQVRAVGQRDVETDRWNLRRDLLDKLCECDVEEQRAIISMIDDVGQLIG